LLTIGYFALLNSMTYNESPSVTVSHLAPAFPILSGDSVVTQKFPECLV